MLTAAVLWWPWLQGVTEDTEEFHRGQLRRARHWREAAALQRRRHVIGLLAAGALQSQPQSQWQRCMAGEDCGYSPDEPWTCAVSPVHQPAVRLRNRAVSCRVVS